MSYTRLAITSFAPDAELAAFIKRLGNEGAVVSFTGLTRAHDSKGSAVDALFLDHYPGMTETSLEEIANAALERFEISDVTIVHRCGQIAPPDPIVFVAAAAIHRRDAFDAADYMMDRLKTDAVFWKREHAAAIARWIEPRDADHADCARWSA